MADQGKGQTNPPPQRVVPRRNESRIDAEARLAGKHRGSGISAEGSVRFSRQQKSSDPPDPPRKGKKRGRGGAPSGVAASSDVTTASTGGSGLPALMNRPTYSGSDRISVRQPQREASVPGGGTFATPYGRDPFRTHKLEAMIMPYTAVNWNSLWNDGASTDTIAPLVASKVASMFEILVDAINYRGKFTPNQVLTAITDWPTFLNNYHIAMSCLYAVLSVFEAVDLNPSFRAFGTAIGTSGLIERAKFDWHRLNLVPMAPGFPKLVAKLSGVFINADEDWAYVTYVNSGDNPTTVEDWTLATGIGIVLTAAETALSLLELGTTEGNIIHEILANVYGPPEVLPTPKPHLEPQLFDLHFTRVCSMKGSTSGNYFSQPNFIGNTLGGAAQVFPILARRGMEIEPLAFTLLKPMVYPNNYAAATSRNSGLLSLRSSEQGFGRIYTSGVAASNNIIVTDAKTDATFGTENMLTDPPTFFEIEWWYALAANNTTIGFQMDVRLYDRWDVFYATNGQILSPSTSCIDTLFAEGMRTS